MARARQAASPPRRITRSSLARFAYNASGDCNIKTTISKGEYDDEEKTLMSSPDIEDIIPDQTLSVSRKRKRVAANPASVPVSRRVKKEESQEAEEEDAAKAVNNLEEKVEGFESEETITMTTSTNRKPARKKTTKNQPPSSEPSKSEIKTTSTVKPPKGWEEIYETVKAMRYEPDGAAFNAPVDTMGCERLAQPDVSARDQRFQTLVALMLSSQTKDTVNAVAMRRLQTELPPASPSSKPGLNLENIIAAPPEVLNSLIRAVGFHNNKTKYLQQAAMLCRDRHGGDIPDTIDGLVALPGVGPKMAHLCLSAAWDRTEGIGVDVHVHRITNLWGWHGVQGTKNPEETRRKLESWLPRDRWREINTLLVGLGQTVCLPVGRRCGECEVGLKGLCRAAEKKKVLEGRKRVKMKKEEEESVLVKEVDNAGDGDVVVERKEVKVEVDVEVEVEEKDVVVNEEVKEEENKDDGVDPVKKEDLDA